MSILKWNEYEVLECLEVAPKTEEYDISFSYEIVQEKLTLLLTIWQYDSLIKISLLDTAERTPVMDIEVLVRGGIVRKKYRIADILELQDCVIVPAKMFYDLVYENIHDQKLWPYGLTLEVSIKPHLWVGIKGNI